MGSSGGASLMWPKKSGEVESRNSLSLPQNEIRLQRQKCWKSLGVLWEGALPLLAVPSPCWDGAGGSLLAPGLGSSLSSAEGTEADKVLNSHIKKKKSQCLLVPQGMVSTDPGAAMVPVVTRRE